MNTKWKVILAVMLLITTICTVFLILVQQQHDDKVAEIIEGKNESAALLADTILSELAQGYQRRIIAFTNPAASPSRELMIQAFADRDRGKLLQLSKPLFAVLKKETPYFSTIGWILPDNHVFLRLKYPEKFGDDISTIRPDVAAVNRDKRQHSGFDVGIRSMQYRIVQPVFHRGEYLGAVQFGFNASIVFDALQNRLNTIAGMAVLNEECDIAQESKVPKLKCRTHTIRARDVTIFEPVQDQLDWNRNQQRVVLNGRSHIILNVLPLLNFQDEKKGVFFVALDIAGQLAQKRKLLVNTLIISSILLISSFLVLYFSYGSLVQKIITLNQSLGENNLELENRVHERTAKLQESEKRLQKILDQAPLGILIADSQTMGFQYVNPAICRMLGYDKEELDNMGVDSVHTAADLDQIVKEFKEQAQGKKNIATDIPFLRKDGTLLGADVFSTPLELEGQPCVVSFVVDLTERKNLEIQLHQAQKMEAIGMMAGGVAHDLNNILSGIVSYPELLLLNLPQSSELREPLRAIQESGKRAANVVADLLTVARGIASTREFHDINVLLKEYLNSPEYKKLKSLHPGVACTDQLDAKHPIISCSPMHIKKTLMNLMTNAAEAVGDGGNVLVSTYNRQIDTSETLEHDMEPGNYVVLSVRDNGPGIAAKDQEHIFEPFYTKKVMGQSGTGLGLTIVWNTVKDHNGRIFVESSEGGTSFLLYFPVSKHGVVVQAENGKTEKLIGNSEHILVVDDESQLRDIASQILRAMGYTVDSVCSGELALKFVKEKPVDLIVLDMLMEPGMNGRQTYEEMLKLNPGQKAIIASGFSESDDVKAALQLGAGGFIKKPYSVAQLGRVVKEALKS